MADNIEELNDLLGINNLIEGFIPKTEETIPGMPPAPSYEIPETMDYGGKVTSKEPIKIEAVAKAPQAQPMPELQMPEMARQKPTGLSSDILEELRKYEGLSPNVEDIVSSSTKSYEPLLKNLEGRKKDATWMDFVNMALPTLIGAAYNQVGVGAKIGGDYGVQRAREIEKRNESIEDAMTRIKGQIAVQQAKKRQTLAEKKVEVMGEDGNAYLVPESFAISRGLQAFKEGSFDKVKYVDSAGEERWARFDKKRGTYTATPGDLLAEKDVVSKSEQGKAERQKLAMSNKAVDDFIKPNSKAANSVDMLESMVSAADILKQGGPVGLGGVKSLIARGVFREVGVLTEQDVGRLGGDLSLYAQAQRFLGKLKKGTALQPEDVEDAYQLLRVVHAREAERLKNYTNQYIELKSPVADPGILGGLNKFTQSLVEPLPKLGSQKENLPTRQKNKELNAALVEEEGTELVSRSIPDKTGKRMTNPDGSIKYFQVLRKLDGTAFPDGKMYKVIGEDTTR